MKLAVFAIRAHNVLVWMAADADWVSLVGLFLGGRGGREQMGVNVVVRWFQQSMQEILNAAGQP